MEDFESLWRLHGSAVERYVRFRIDAIHDDNASEQYIDKNGGRSSGSASSPTIGVWSIAEAEGGPRCCRTPSASPSTGAPLFTGTTAAPAASCDKDFPFLQESARLLR